MKRMTDDAMNYGYGNENQVKQYKVQRTTHREERWLDDKEIEVFVEKKLNDTNSRYFCRYIGMHLEAVLKSIKQSNELERTRKRSSVIS